MIEFYFEEIKKRKIPRNEIRAVIKKISDDYHFNTGILNIIFCDDEYLLEMNRKYLKHDDYTDIITFDYCERDTLNGELFISMERVKENAEAFNEEYENELVRVIIHGILHLVGMNDKNKQESEEMRREEDYYLNVYKKS